MRVLFMGTPDIAAAALEAVLRAGHTVCGVYTREDKPVGRKQILTAPPVKQVALRHGIPVFQPKTLRGGDGSAVENIAALAPELIVVVAYGRILPPEILHIPPHGCVNLHVSLLPQYRGAAPVQWAVMRGEKQTGVSIILLEEGVDTGDVLCVSPVAIGENETAGEVFARVTEEGARTLVQAMDDLAAGTAVRTPQNHALATLAPLLTKEMARINFALDAQTLHNFIRGMNPWPVAYFMHEGKKIKVLRSLLVPCAQVQEGVAIQGTVLCIKPDRKSVV